MANKVRKRIQFTECTLQPGNLDIDPQAPIIRNVRILGPKSENGRVYLESYFESALPLYEGAKVNIDHLDGTATVRPFNSRFGWLENVRRQDGGLNGDLKFNPKHSQSESFRWWAQNRPSAIGLSHDAIAEGYEQEDGTFAVEKGRKVNGVDLVADPATTKGLYESKILKGKEAMEPDPKLTNDSSMDDLDEDDTLDEPPAGDAEVADLATQVAELVKSIAASSDLDKAAKLSKIKKALDMLHDGDKKPDTETAPEAKKVVKPDDATALIEALKGSTDPNVKAMLTKLEGYQLKEQLDAKRQQAKKVCKDKNLPSLLVSELFLEQLMACHDEAAMTKLVEERHSLIATIKSKPISPGKIQPKVTEAEVNKLVDQLVVDDE